MKKFLTFILLASLLHSCIPKKNLVYFQGELQQIDSVQRIQETPYRLMINDILNIQIKSPDKDLVALFTTQITGGNSNLRYSEQAQYFSGYSIDNHGNIRLPYIGEINVLGYTTREVREKIDEAFSNYFKNSDDVFVTVKLAGVRVTILGEVKTTGTLIIYPNQVTLVDAIATAGDITLVGNRKNVSIFRRGTDGTERFIVNMLDLASFNRDNFYIQSNDVIYVEPLKQKSWGTGATGMQTLTTIIAIFSLLTTTLLLINAFK
jgi:polysaccharide export outer membrane protein